MKKFGRILALTMALCIALCGCGGERLSEETAQSDSAPKSWELELEGEYSCEFTWSRNDYQFYAHANGDDPVEYEIRQRDHDEDGAMWETSRTGTLEWISLSQFTADDFLLKRIDTSDYMRRYYEKGYTVRYEGMDFDEMEYAAFTDPGSNKHFAVVFAGPDGVYVTANVADVDRQEFEIVVRCVPANQA